ncbi:MAG: endonuclease MutS2, partial [Ruminococcaceae bacterium]|nr:endonuclease MutS2 [Oscillospiraceae bacterium]
LVHDVSSSGATLFVEPMAAVKANNEIRELKAKEKAEIERILAELSAECAAHREEIDADFHVLLALDGIFARARLSDKLDCCAPELSERTIRLRRARHPLLDQKTAVPIDVELGGSYDALVITGPNTGGKTVTLKTIGLLCLMAQCGLHIPAAEGSSVPVLERVLADIGDEQSIEQSLSTFSSHMTTLVTLLEECDEKSLLLFDELGAGTDPTEGAALAIAILEHARSRGSVLAATTHYAELKVYGTNTPGVMNASCEFDVDTLRPTYRLLLGIPGKSNAFAISRRLGLPEEIIEDARSRMGVSSVLFEETIEKLEEARRLLDRDRMEEAKLLRNAEEEAKKAARLRSELEVKLDKAEEKARREAERILTNARAEAERTFDELAKLRQELELQSDHRRVNDARSETLRRLNAAREAMRKQEEEAIAEKSVRPVEVGDVVAVQAMGGAKATVLSISADRVLQLQVGILKLSAKEDEVTLLINEKPKPVKVQSSVHATLRKESTSSELDIRGMETLEAIPIVERYIDSCSQNGLETVTVIHGKGTGALRTAVQQSLKRHKLVKSFRLGRYGEGESGVTVVELK